MTTKSATRGRDETGPRKISKCALYYLVNACGKGNAKVAGHMCFFYHFRQQPSTQAYSVVQFNSEHPSLPFGSKN